MIDTSIGHFISMYHAGTLNEDITYRAYDLEKMISPAKAKSALKQLNYNGSKEFSLRLNRFQTDWGLKTNEQAIAVLSMWWVWSRLSQRIIVKAPLREPEQHD